MERSGVVHIQGKQVRKKRIKNFCVPRTRERWKYYMIKSCRIDILWWDNVSRERETVLNIWRLCGVPFTRFRLDLATGDRKSSVSAIKWSNKHLFILEASLTRLANFRYSRPREWSLLSRQQRATLLRRWELNCANFDRFHPRRVLSISRNSSRNHYVHAQTNAILRNFSLYKHLFCLSEWHK